MTKFKQLIERIKGVHVVIAFMVLLVGVASPFVVKLDNRWLHAADGMNLQQTIELQQKTIQQMNSKFSIEIAKLKYDNRKEQYNDFVVQHGEDISTMTEAEKIKFLSLKDKLEEVEREYENLL